MALMHSVAVYEAALVTGDVLLKRQFVPSESSKSFIFLHCKSL